MIHEVKIMGSVEYLSIIIRLMIAMIMGAVIGYERASKKVRQDSAHFPSSA